MNELSQSGAGVPPPLESGSLLRAARAAGFEPSQRKLETLRAQDLLPKPTRSGNRGRVPVWIYPPGTDTQLVSLLRWREFTKDPDTLKVLLWLDGFPVTTAQVRASLVKYMRSALNTIDQEINARAEQMDLKPDRPEDRRAAVSAIAGQLAGRRGPKAPPRRARVSAADRKHAFELVMRAFALGEDVQATEAEAESVEKVLGVAPNGRRDQVPGAGPWLTGPATALFDATEVISIPSALQAASDASDVELETARGLILAIFRYMPLMARLGKILFEKNNYAGLAGLQDLNEQPELAVFMVPIVVSMLRAGWQDHLSQIADALGGLAEVPERAARLLNMPSKAVEANLHGQPQQTKQIAQRLIDAAVDGDLGLPELKPPARSKESRSTR